MKFVLFGLEHELEENTFVFNYWKVNQNFYKMCKVNFMEQIWLEKNKEDPDLVDDLFKEYSK
jgi:hypothetical protein